MDITSLSQLQKELQKRINLALKVDVAETVKEEMVEVIKDETFVQYVPQGENPYQRRTTDGLDDISNIHMTEIDSNTVSIKNETQGNNEYENYYNGNIDGIIVSGNGYGWKNSNIYAAQQSGSPIVRDFYEGTVRRLQLNKAHILKMKIGLVKQGLKVE